MKKFIILFFYIFMCLPAMANFSDDYFNYFINDEISFFKDDNNFLYNIELIPTIKGFNNDRSYKLKVFHYLNNNYIKIYSIDAYDKNNNYLFESKDKYEIEKIINSSSVKLKEFIIKNYTSCVNDGYNRLTCYKN